MVKENMEAGSPVTGKTSASAGFEKKKNWEQGEAGRCIMTFM